MATKKATAKKSTAKKPAKKATAKKSTAKKPAAKKPAKKATAKKSTAKKPAAKKPAKKATAKKAPAKKATAKKATTKKAAKPKTKRKPNAAFMAPMQPDSILGAVVGERAMPRTEITKKLWDYIKKNGLQDATNRRQINADDKLRAVFGKSKVTMFEMNALIQGHLSKG